MVSDLKKLITRFSALDDEDRSGLRNCLSLSPRFRELAVSHPLAALAFAQPYGPDERRAEAVQRLEEGRALQRVCQSLSIPYALRSIPAQACPASLAYFDWPAKANNRLKNSIPGKDADTQLWLETVFYGARAAGSDFGLWIGQNSTVFQEPEIELGDMLPLALYAWYSCSRTFIVSQLIETRWQGQMGLRSACMRTAQWLEQIALSTYSDLHASSFASFEFVELRSRSCIKEEVVVMKNCLESYGRALNIGRCRLFGVRLKGVRLATMKIEKGPDEAWKVRRILGRRNHRVPAIINMAAACWVECLSDYDLPYDGRVSRPNNNKAISKLFSAYCDGQQEFETWMPEVTLEGLFGSIEKLSLKVNSN